MGAPLNWDQYRLAQIWEMVKNESTAVGERQAQAWTDTAELCEDQANQLERAAAQLAQTWVPTPGTAAEGFQQWLRRFTDSMRGSASAARTNSATISDITYQMAAAREKIARLMAQGNQYQQAEQTGTPRYTVPGRVPPPAQPRGPNTPPLGWRNTLDQQAREVMTHTETTVILQADRVQIPPKMADLGSERIDAPPPIPAPTWPGQLVGGQMFAHGESLASAAITAPMLPNDPGHDPFGEDSLPVLDGFNPGSLPGPVPTDHWPTPGSIRTTPIETVTGLVQTPAGPALAPGGMIGVRQPSDSPSSGQRSTTQPHVTGTNTASRSGVMPPMVPPPVGARSGAGQSPIGGRGGGVRRGKHHDPTDPWAVPEGGPAVLQPPTEPIEHDPGPGVIGLDR